MECLPVQLTLKTVMIAAAAVAGLSALIASVRSPERHESVQSAVPRSTTALPLDGTDSLWQLICPHPAGAQIHAIAPADPGAADGAGMQVAVVEATPKAYWSTQIRRCVAVPVNGNHDVILHFWARAVESSSMYVIFEGSGEHSNKELNQRIDLTSTWTEFSLPFRTASVGYPPHGSRISFQLGLAPAQFEFSGISLLDLGPRPIAAASPEHLALTPIGPYKQHSYSHRPLSDPRA